jgi:small subunit ribosomal protein S20
MIKSRVRTAIRKFADQVQSSSREEAEKGYIQCQALLDRAVSKGIFHRNLAARKKHRLYRLLQKQS